MISDPLHLTSDQDTESFTLAYISLPDALNRAKQSRDIKRHPRSQFPSRYRPNFKNDHYEYKHYETRLVQFEGKPAMNALKMYITFALLQDLFFF